MFEDFMALTYLLDGYNITTQIPSLALKGFKDSRDGLVSLIEIYRPQGSRQNRVTIVFDGKSGMVNLENLSPTSAVQVVFSQGESADDKIRSIISSSNKKKQIVVVTDDKELRFSVRALGAAILGVKDFLSKIKKRGISPLAKNKCQEKEDGKNISQTLQYKITAEFEKIWLKK